jgi:TPR repeat protein
MKISSLTRKVASLALCCSLVSGQVAGVAQDNLARIRDMAARGDANALFALGLRSEADGTEANNMEAAAHFYTDAAAKGHPSALVRLGYLYQTGAGVNRDPRKALALYQQAAAAGDVEGEFRLGVAYINGVGTDVNPGMGRMHIARAADGGHQQSQLMLGVMQHMGVGGVKNEFSARRWLQRASEGGDRSIASDAATLRSKIDERIFYSGSPLDRDIASILAAGFGLLALVAIMTPASSNRSASSATPYDPSRYDEQLDRLRRRQNCAYDALSAPSSSWMGTYSSCLSTAR